MKTQPTIGISGCLTGSAVRFDGGHKRMGFVMDELAQWVTFSPVCPEMAMGLPVPRPALRLVQTASGETRMRFSQAPNEDVTQKIDDFTAAYLPRVAELAGFIVCAKSPSCGMERVRLYDEKGGEGVKRAWGVSPARYSRRTRGCRSKKTVACTTRYCARTLWSAYSLCMSSIPCGHAV
jgi:uncharacterized protein YbbK (DUF523 family)